jgi:hypothetical protein
LGIGVRVIDMLIRVRFGFVVFSLSLCLSATLHLCLSPVHGVKPRRSNGTKVDVHFCQSTFSQSTQRRSTPVESLAITVKLPGSWYKRCKLVGAVESARWIPKAGQQTRWVYLKLLASSFIFLGFYSFSFSFSWFLKLKKKLHVLPRDFPSRTNKGFKPL